MRRATYSSTRLRWARPRTNSSIWLTRRRRCGAGSSGRTTSWSTRRRSWPAAVTSVASRKADEPAAECTYRCTSRARYREWERLLALLGSPSLFTSLWIAVALICQHSVPMVPPNSMTMTRNPLLPSSFHRTAPLCGTTKPPAALCMVPMGTCQQQILWHFFSKFTPTSLIIL